MDHRDFTDAVKLQARRLAFFRCCYCHDRQGDDVHHLIPKEDGGLAELENAILLCVQCHADYGHRSDKRAQLRQARDHWYEIVAKRYSPVALGRVEQLNAIRSDIRQMSAQLRALTETVIGNFERGSTGASDVANIASTMISSIAPPPSHVYPHPSNMPSLVEPLFVPGSSTSIGGGGPDESS